MGSPFDGQWRLHDLKADPTESRDLSAEQPERLRTMLADVEAYNRANGVILPEPGYDPVKQLLRNNWPVLLKQLWMVLAAALGGLAALIWAVAWGLRRRRRASGRTSAAH